MWENTFHPSTNTLFMVISLLFKIYFLFLPIGRLQIWKTLTVSYYTGRTFEHIKLFIFQKY